uniref:Uncharacterized protein n=1 Tax=Opuntia streptacantha TaxID=393608 RepID=A0A7C9AL09_OPUST
MLTQSKIRTPSPPVFEPSVATGPTKNLTQGKQSFTISKRVTRSRVRSKDSAARGQKKFNADYSEEPSKEQSPQTTSSTETSESVALLAKEALEIGNLLGVKVVGKEKGALKRLTASLKKRVSAYQWCDNCIAWSLNHQVKSSV